MTVPNALSLFRLILVPVFAVVFFGSGPNAHRDAALIYLVAFLTDVADGWIARHFNQISKLGRILDPAADKLMTSARRFSLSWCRRAVVRCGQTDLAMKSTGQDAQELLTGLLLELAAPSRPAGRQGARG